MSYQNIIQDIKNKKLHPIYLLHGEESFFIDQIENAIEENILTESEKSFNLSIYYGKDTDVKTIIDAAKRFPMMSEKQIVIVREAQDLKKIDELASYVKSPMPSTILVISHKYKKLDGRSQLSKLCTAKGEVFESKSIPSYQIGDWIGNCLKDHKIQSSPDIQNILANNLGNDLTKITNEIEKLKLNLPQGTKLDREMIDKYIGISKEFSIFELQRFIGEKNVIKTIQTAMYFASNIKKNPLTFTVDRLANYFNQIYLMHFAKSLSEIEQLKILKVKNAFFLKEYREAASRYSLISCEKAINLLKSYDLKAKGVDNINSTDEDLTKELCIRLVNLK